MIGQERLNENLVHRFCGDGYLGYPIDQADSWKQKQRISSIQILPGGDTVNQCVFLAQMGVTPMLGACVGGDTNGDILKHVLREKQVDISCVREKSECSTGTAIVLVNEQGEWQIFSAKGAHDTISKEDVPWELPEECKAVSLASVFSMLTLERDGLWEYLVHVKKQGKLVFADLAADKLGLGLKGIERYLPYIDYFLPSLYDVLTMAQARTAEEAARFFYNAGVKHVIVKCGNSFLNGNMICGRKGVYTFNESFEK